MWIADASSPSLAGFEPHSGQRLWSMALDQEPLTVSATAGLVVVGTASSILALDVNTSQPQWHCAARSQQYLLKGSTDHICTWNAAEAVFSCFDGAGNEHKIDAEGVTVFAPGPNGVYWLSAAGTLRLSPYAASTRGPVAVETSLLPGQAQAMVFCANGLWIAAPAGLFLCHPISLEQLAKLAIPEGSATHLICAGYRLYGGFRQAFVYNPAADAGVRALPVSLENPMCGLAVARNKLWVLESERSVIHVLDVP
jgi:hypothetical protein